ncbi:hypothetical protein LK996_00720 [Lysobacter sp. A6]|uniref:Transposase n=1 Tax=Noviluteimonas lactosilytica TaxID=2888523 RepID=A0ABS8JDC4_9GAMM|nr:hypothetical protein [Lysobacter lactosilyticus]MCC8361606.1 hypothetical protein [Lysobacter lactosilyticus]
MTTEIKASELVALAKELNRQICDLNAQVNTLRAQLLEAAHTSRARDRSRMTRRPLGRGASASPTIWHFGPEPGELSLDGRCHLLELPHDARD